MNSYSIGSLKSTSDIAGTTDGAGGLFGSSFPSSVGTISTSYSVGGLISGNSVNYGGFIGFESQSTFSNDYWNTTTSGTNNGLPGRNIAGLTGLTTTQLTAGLPPGFDPAIWAESPTINHGYPYLLANPPR